MLEKILQGKNSLFLMDLSWHLHRNSHTFENMCVDVDGYQRPTGHIYGVLSTIKMIRKYDENSVIIICQDGYPKERLEAVEGYKEGRPELKYDFYKDVNIIKASSCILPNIYWAFNEDKESDDEMYALAKQAVKVFDGKVYIYSGDNDLLQALEERIVIVRQKQKNGNGFDEIVESSLLEDRKLLEKFNGVNVKHLVNYRAIVGDSSDKIQGIPRFPRKLAVNIAMSTDCICDGHNYKPVTDTEVKYCKLLAENKDLIRRNYKAMKLTDDYVVTLTKPKVRLQKLYEMLEELKVKSWLKYLNEELGEEE